VHTWNTVPITKGHNWVKYFDDLYSRKINSGLAYETQLLGPQYTKELDSDFMKEEMREIYWK
jgi:hypothetical protein